MHIIKNQKKTCVRKLAVGLQVTCFISHVFHDDVCLAVLVLTKTEKNNIALAKKTT